MHRSIANLLFPEYRRRVLGLLLLRPDEALHGREIARRTGLSPGTTTRELIKLAEAGLLRRQKRGNQQVYSADRECPVFGELASILRKTSGLADVIAQLLAPVADRLRCAFIFGSLARGEETTHSDIDLMLIGRVGFIEAAQLLQPAQAELQRELNPKVFGVDEFAAKSATDPFLRDVLAKPRIFVFGSERELAELAGRQP